MDPTTKIRRHSEAAAERVAKRNEIRDREGRAMREWMKAYDPVLVEAMDRTVREFNARVRSFYCELPRRK